MHLRMPITQKLCCFLTITFLISVVMGSGEGLGLIKGLGHWFSSAGEGNVGGSQLAVVLDGLMRTSVCILGHSQVRA